MGCFVQRFLGLLKIMNAYVASERGVVCEKCGVEVTLSKVRRERMGHKWLALWRTFGF